MKKSYKKLICIFMSLFMLLSALPLTVHAATTVINVETAEQLTAACATINESGGVYTINLTADITGGEIAITNSNAVVTVVGNGHTLHAQSQYVYVKNGATVNLGDGNSELIIQSDNQPYDNPGLVYVLNGSYCNMYDKVTLKDFKGDNHLGGGVTVEGGTFHMYGGTIKNCGIGSGSVCYGGGVAVFAGGSFIMDGGVITQCYTETSYNDGENISSCGGGVFVSAISSFTMNGGTISKNTATNTGGGIACGGGVALIISNNEMVDYAMGNPQSTVTINKGIITGNSADLGGGVFASGYYKAYGNALGTATPSGGVPQNPGLYINGGEISANTAGEGGGIFAMCLCPWTRKSNVQWNGSKTQIHNATIKNNIAENGAGIESYAYWTQMDIDGCTITENTADSYGGGIALLGNGSSGLTKLKNSTVTDNTSGDIGAGVLYDADSRLYISGKNVIQDNTYNNKLNNLNIYMKNGTVYPVYVNGDLTGSQIGLSDPTLWGDGKEDADPEAVSTEYLTNGYKENNPEVHPSEYFTSDHETWIVDRSAKTTTTTTDPSSKTRRQYPVKRYPIKEDTYPYYYAGHESQYVITKIQNPSVTDVSTTDAIISELRYRFPESKYTFSSGGNPSAGYIVYNYSPIFSDSPLSSVSIEKRPGLNYVTITYYPKRDNSFPPNPPTSTTRSYGGSVVYTANPSDQSKYADSGELVLKISSNGDSNLNNSTYFNFSEQSTDETINYVDADPPGNDLYEYNEYGDVTAKYVIEKADAYTPVQATITVESGTDEEVRLVRKKVNYHINNDVIDDNYGNNDIFTDEVEAKIGEIKVGETIERFYLIPEATPTKQNSCPYIFKGWYYDQDNNNDAHPVHFGTDKYMNDIYAHWIKVNSVAKDAEDDNILPGGETEYGGFDLAGVQVREGIRDTNFDGRRKPGGLRFVTSLNTDIVDAINAIQPNNIEYGYVAATNKGWIEAHSKVNHKLQYVSKTANGIDTSNTATDENYFDFAKNINCTSKVANSKGVVELDHRNFGDYLLYTLVITYENCEDDDYAKNVLARPYIRYTDANNSERVAYSEYRGTSVLGGCSTNYNAVKEHQGG